MNFREMLKYQNVSIVQRKEKQAAEVKAKLTLELKEKRGRHLPPEPEIKVDHILIKDMIISILLVE